MTRPGERPRDALGRPLPAGSPSAIPFEDHARRSLEENLLRGAEHFAAGRFFQAHEAWEEAWRQGKAATDVEFLKGLAQLGAGYTHIARGNAHGARVLLTRALERMEPYAPRHRGMALAPACRAIRTQIGAATVAGEHGHAPPLLEQPDLRPEGPPP